MKLKKTILAIGILCLFSSLNASSVEEINKNLNVDFYGQIRIDAIYDTDEFNSAQSPIVVKNQPAGRNPDGEFNLHPRLTRLGTNISKHYDEYAMEVTGKVEIDFQNGGSQSREILRLRHAYVNIKKDNFSLLIGQTWQTVSRLIPMANGDTLMWGAGNTGDRSPQIRATYSVPFSGSSKIDFEVALQQIGTVDSKGQAGTNFGGMPAYQGRISLDSPLWTHKPFHLAVGVHQANEVLSEKGFGENKFNQFGVFSELILPIMDKLEIQAEYFTGENISDLRGGILFGINPLQDKEIPTQGYWAEARYSPFEKFNFAIGYGQDNPDDNYFPDGFPALNEATWFVAHYQFTKDIRIGLEYIQWATEYKNIHRLTSGRFDTHVLWTF